MARDIRSRLSLLHEDYLANMIEGGVASRSSGNQWHDPADGKTALYDELNIAWDCKSVMPQTNRLSITRDDLQKITEQARGRGVGMPLRWYGTERGDVEWDMMLIPLDEWGRLRELALWALEAMNDEGELG